MFKLLLLAGTISLAIAVRLEVNGTDLVYNGEKVYLSGANAAWNVYGFDFGNGMYDGTLEQWLREISESGGNSMRIWVHVEGYNTPSFDSDGYVTSCDNSGDFINDVVRFLDAAQTNDILIILVLWNGALVTNELEVNLILDDLKMQSYLDNCLVPLAEAIAGHPALGAWEAMNELEGSIIIEPNENPCYDTLIYGPSDASWNDIKVPVQKLLRFVGKINTVVRELDPTGLITIGSWSQFSQTDAFEDTRNLYTDECLNEAAESSTAGIDFYQMHTYEKNDSWSNNAPFTVNAADYLLDKPNVLGEFNSICGLDIPLEDLHEYGYTNGYSGTMTWAWWSFESVNCVEGREKQATALAQLANRTENGVVDFEVL